MKISCFETFFLALSFRAVIETQWFLLRRLGPLLSSLTTEITIKHWEFHLFIHDGSQTTAIRPSRAQVFPSISILYPTTTCKAWLVLLDSSHILPLQWRFLLHLRHISVTASRDSGTPATIVGLPAVMIKDNVMWLNSVACCMCLKVTSYSSHYCVMGAGTHFNYISSLCSVMNLCLNCTDRSTGSKKMPSQQT